MEDERKAAQAPKPTRQGSPPAKNDERPPRPRGNISPDTILIGKKPLMAYATAVMMHFNGGRKEVTVKARGRAISHAVDVVEVVRRRFFAGKLVVREVKIGTEIVGGNEGEESRNVSTIEIKLEKTD